MTSTNYIKDKKKLIEVLFEEAFGVGIDVLVDRWQDYTNMGLSVAKVGKLLFAYQLAQEYKEELSFYPYLAFQVACHHDFPWDRFEHDVLIDLLPFCHDKKLLAETEHAIRSIEKRWNDEDGYGFKEEAKPFVENLQVLYDALGEDVTLHDAVVTSVNYDRNEESATVIIDTFNSWENHRPSLVTLRFNDILDIHWNADISSDYASEFVCYYLEQCGGCIEFLLKSVDFRVSCKTMTVVSVAERD